MFYEKQPKTHQDAYKNMLQIVGSLSRLFSDSETPYLYYRAHENIFAKYFEVENNARSDDSADAYSNDGIGIGLKTWVGQDNQKVAEFGRLRPQYEHLDGMDLIQAIAGYRNLRIRTTMNFPYLAADRERSENFFPPKDVPFDLLLPDGTWISTKVCQNAFAKVSDAKYAQMGPDEQAKEDKRRRTGKAIMSNPNSVLGKWILRDVLELPEGQVITYDMLRQYGIDSVIFTRIDDGKYAVDFGELGTYEKFYGLADSKTEDEDE